MEARTDVWNCKEAAWRWLRRLRQCYLKGDDWDILIKTWTTIYLDKDEETKELINVLSLIQKVGKLSKSSWKSYNNLIISNIYTKEKFFQITDSLHFLWIFLEAGKWFLDHGHNKGGD